MSQTLTTSPVGPTIATRHSDATGIFYRHFAPIGHKPFWQHVDMNDKRGAQVGPHYKTKEALLLDHDDYLVRAGWQNPVDSNSALLPLATDSTPYLVFTGWHMFAGDSYTKPFRCVVDICSGKVFHLQLWNGFATHVWYEPETEQLSSFGSKVKVTEGGLQLTGTWDSCRQVDIALVARSNGFDSVEQYIAARQDIARS